MPNPRWASKDEAAQHVGVSVYTIERWATQGRITAYRFGKRILRYDLNQLDAMAAAASGEEATA